MQAPAFLEKAKKYASYRKALYEKKSGAVEQTLWQEPDGRVHLQILYRNFARPILKDYPCRYLGSGKYKCETFIIDTNKKTIQAKLTLTDALKESPVVYNSVSFLKDTAVKTVLIGIITGLSVYAITRLIDSLIKKRIA